MDYILLLIGLVMIFRRNYPWLFAIIIVLASTYLQLPLKVEMQMMIGPQHNVGDTGLLLYLIFWFNEVIKNGVYITNTMSKVISIFLLFLLLNGLYDIIEGVSLGDVARYLKTWAYLSIVYTNIQMNLDDVKKIIKIIFWITFAISLVLVLQYLAGAAWIGYTTHYSIYTRGAKPPSFAIICCCLAFVNVFKFSEKVRIITTVGLFLPVLFSMKMSYFTTISLILISNYLLKQQMYIEKLFKYLVVCIVGAAVLFTAFPVFYQRFQETVRQTGVSSSSRIEEGNFSYRIEHFAERLNYILQKPVRSVRGLGYVQERNFHERPFKLGQTNLLGRKAMLDTGDIAWSLLILRLGLVGLLLYFIVYGRCLHILWQERNSDEIISVFFSYMLISLVFMSFGNTLIAHSDFFIIPLLIICFVKHEDSTLHLGA